MNILVFSDTHGQTDDMISVIRSYGRHVDAVLHLGDHIRDTDRVKQEFQTITVTGVPGNCDFGSALWNEPMEKTVSYDGVRFFLTHGHLRNAERTYDGIVGQAKREQAGIALYGHTHVPFFSEVRGVILLNPGSLTRPRGTSVCSYGLITVDHGAVSCKICPLSRETR